MTEFKDKLKELRHSQNYTQKGLGELLYVSRSTVAKWEAGLVFPADEYLDRLCEVFGVGREAFFRDAEQEKLNSKKNRTISKQKRLIFLMSGVLAILLALAIVLPIVVSRGRRKDPHVPTTIPAPVIRLNGGDEYLGFGVTRPDERDGQMEVYVVTNILTKEVLRRMTVNPIPDGGRITLTTDFAPESVAAYFFEVTDEFLYITEDGTYDPDERKGWFNMDFAAPLTVTGSAPTFTVTFPERTDHAGHILVRIEITVCGDTFRYFALYD